MMTIAKADKIVERLKELQKTDPVLGKCSFVIKHVEAEVLNSYKIEIH